ncbi:hypothetical protein L9F63_000885, partial [Diploptera punctata]
WKYIIIFLDSIEISMPSCSMEARAFLMRYLQSSPSIALCFPTSRFPNISSVINFLHSLKRERKCKRDKDGVRLDKEY